jgi:hypothetical protein
VFCYNIASKCRTAHHSKSKFLTWMQQFVSPELLNARNLELAVPGTYRAGIRCGIYLVCAMSSLEKSRLTEMCGLRKWIKKKSYSLDCIWRGLLAQHHHWSK